MSCNFVIHNDLKKDGELICPFCDKQLTTLPNTVDPCCSEQDMNGKNTCDLCGKPKKNYILVNVVKFFVNTIIIYYYIYVQYNTI